MSNTGTYVYANSFVAPENGTVEKLGAWFLDYYSGGVDFMLQVLGSSGGNSANGPDINNVLAETAQVLGLSAGPALAFFEYDTNSSVVLTAGETYWFAANAIGGGGTGGFYVGGHTQNSGGIVDNGTFWYSNSSDGSAFDGSNLTPEMAFQVTMAGAVPEPTTLALMGLGLAGIESPRVFRRVLSLSHATMAGSSICS